MSKYYIWPGTKYFEKSLFLVKIASLVVFFFRWKIHALIWAVWIEKKNTKLIIYLFQIIVINIWFHPLSLCSWEKDDKKVTSITMLFFNLSRDGTFLLESKVSTFLWFSNHIQTIGGGFFLSSTITLMIHGYCFFSISTGTNLFFERQKLLFFAIFQAYSKTWAIVFAYRIR